MRSSFVEGTQLQYAWDATSLNDLKICPRRYQLSRIEGWEWKAQSIHLKFGMEVHHTIQDYEFCKVDGQDHEEAVFNAIRALMQRTGDYPSEEEVKTQEKASARRKTKEVLLRTCINYLDHYKEDPVETLILESGRPAIEVNFNFDLERKPHLLCGILDKIGIYQESQFVLDHKTTTYQLTEYYYDKFNPDCQMSVYSIAGQVVVHSPIRGVIIDGITIGADGVPGFGRGFTYRNQGQLEEWLHNLDYLLSQAEQYAQDQYWPQNDTACDKYGGCPFRRVCSKAPSVREAYLRADFNQLPENERWNPLSIRETSIAQPADE